MLNSIIRNKMPSAALIVAAVALIVAMAGSAVALKGKNTVDAGDLKKDSVRTAEIQENAIGSSEVAAEALAGVDIRDGGVTGADIADDGLKGSDVDESSLSLNIPSDEVQEYPPNSFRVTATIGANEAEARVAAPEIPLTSNGPLSLYGKCFYDVATNDVYGETYIRTTQDGSIFESRAGDDKPGGPAATDFLNDDTPEVERQIEESQEPTLNEVHVDYDDEEPFFAAAPDGTQIHGLFEVAVKNGTLPGGDGIYGPGDACIFTGFTFG